MRCFQEPGKFVSRHQCYVGMASTADDYRFPILLDHPPEIREALPRRAVGRFDSHDVLYNNLVQVSRLGQRFPPRTEVPLPGDERTRLAHDERAAGCLDAARTIGSESAELLGGENALRDVVFR